MTKKKVAIIGSVGVPANYGGFETLAEGLVLFLDRDFDFTIYCSSENYEKRISNFNHSKLEYIPLRANGWQSIPYDIISILKAIKKNDVLLILGVSGAIILPIIKSFSKAKLIINIDGQEWKRPKWGWLTKKFLKFSERTAVKYADITVADNRFIQKEIYGLYGKESTYIAYGGTHVNKINLTNASYKKYPFIHKPYAFTVCRIVPENSVHQILEAFSEYPKMNLVFVGNWENSKYGTSLRRKYNSFSNIYLIDPIYEKDKLNELRSNCKVYINGHTAGGTPPSLVEAMCLALPTVIFDTDCNRAATNNKALYYNSKESLIDCLYTLDDNYLSRVSIDMLKIAKENYTWEIIGKKYANIF